MIIRKLKGIPKTVKRQSRDSSQKTVKDSQRQSKTVKDSQNTVKRQSKNSQKTVKRQSKAVKPGRSNIFFHVKC